MARDILIGRVINDAELRTALATMLALRADQVHIVHDLAELPPLSGRDLSVLSIPMAGEFPTFITLFFGEGDSAFEIRTVRHLARTLRADVLTADDTLNPFLMLRATKAGDLERVSVKVELEDEYSVEYVVEVLPVDWTPNPGRPSK